jgi:ABC transporter related protein
MEWCHVAKRYPKASRFALNDVSFAVEPGEIVVLVGPNGSGKTTAMEMISALRLPTSGEVLVNGEAVRASAPQRALIGVQLQETGLPQRLKVREAIRAVAALYADPGPVDEIVSQLGLGPYMSQAVGSLSGGWARRLDVVLACIGRPRALVLDEPTSGIDPVARAELWEFLRRRRSEGMAVLASTHDLSEAEAYADRLLVLHGGRLVLQGAVDDVLGLAGGRWRLRLIGVEPSVDAWARTHDVELVEAGDTRVLIADQRTVTAVGDQIEAARDGGELRYQDILKGPIRLEDVFAEAVSQLKQEVAR